MANSPVTRAGTNVTQHPCLLCNGRHSLLALTTPDSTVAPRLGAFLSSNITKKKHEVVNSVALNSHLKDTGTVGQ